MAATGAERVGRVRAAPLHQGRLPRGHRRRIPLLVVITEGVPVQDTAEVVAPTPRQHWARPGSSAPTAPASSRPGVAAGITPPHRRQGPDRPGVEVGHADLPDDVRAARPRLLHRDRHRRRPDHRHHPHRRARGVREGPRDQGDRDDRRDRRRRRGARGGVHQGARDQAGRRLRRGLHRPRGQDDGPRRRHRVGLVGHRAGQEGGPRGGVGVKVGKTPSRDRRRCDARDRQVSSCPKVVES
jgi:hypothetical protein